MRAVTSRQLRAGCVLLVWAMNVGQDVQLKYCWLQPIKPRSRFRIRIRCMLRDDQTLAESQCIESLCIWQL